MKFAIILFCFFSLAFAEVEFAFKVSGRNLRRDNQNDPAPPKTRVDVKLKYPGYYEDYIKSAEIDSNYDPDWAREFFFVYPDGVNATFHVRVWEFNRIHIIGDQYFTASQLSEKGVLVKRLNPDHSMKIIVTQTEPNQPTCGVCC